MEQQEKKKRKIQRSISTQSSSMSSIPLDVTSKILAKLPAKSVLRARCVSKQWSSISTDPYFISNMFPKQSSSSLLIFFKPKRKLFVISIHQNPNEPQHVVSYQMKFPNYCRFGFRESVHGLICFRIAKKPIIWNPTLRKFSTLPKPKSNWKGKIVFLGHDPVACEHKVVCMPRDKASDKCRVLTLGTATQKKWRTINIINHKHLPFSNTIGDNDGQCINGVLYYRACLDQSNVDIIMSFDVRSEKFNMIEVPWGNGWWGKLIPYAASYNDQPLQALSGINGITDDGEFIYVAYVLDSFYILYYDPEKKSYRRVDLQGVGDADFMLRSGLGNMDGIRIHTCLNIESLLSL
ncbi:unnamed protein product [Arabidopsis thaliana]|uniref:F-box domain-containing protein n=2 Tax=Arabidopsis thaliana TaxID=3702 RepID=A0A5S9WNM9_ARATH|nr:unnamed protein product [Arabidopsis thaliana]